MTILESDEKVNYSPNCMFCGDGGECTAEGGHCG